MITSLFEPVTSILTTFPSALAAIVALLKITCVLLTAFAATLVMRQASAGARHLVWLVALGALLILPALAVWSPVPIPVLPAKPAALSVATDAIATAPQPAAPSVESPPAVVSQSTVVETPAKRAPIGIGLLLLGLWSLIALALLVRLAHGAWSVQRIVRGARVLENPEWQRPLYEIADRLGLERAPVLLQSDRIKMPFASGFLAARIVLPADSEQWSPERRSAVLIHELGHVRRRDLIGHTLSRIACALYWFHPLVWTAARRLRAESERACDDLALVLGARPSEYAEHLLDIVSGVRDHGTPAVALAMAHPNEFEGRMLAILNPEIHRRGLSRIETAGLVGTLALVALVVGAVTPAPRAAAKPPVTPPSSSQTQLVTTDDESSSDESSKKTREDDGTVVPETTPVADDMSSRRSRDSEDESTDDADGGKRATVLAKTLRNDSSPEVRRVAAWGLAKYAAADVASNALAAALAGDEDEDVREMSAWALGDGQHSAAGTTALMNAMRRDKSAQVRRTAVWAAGQSSDPSAVEALTAMLADSDPAIREVAAWSIGQCSPQHAPAALIKALSDANATVRLSVAWALRAIEDPAAAEELEAAFQREKDEDVQRGLISALGAMGEGSVDVLMRLVDSPNPEIRSVAVAALAGGNASGPWPWPRPEPRPFP